jgi:ABC-type multidrug transport system ATPase subunit
MISQGIPPSAYWLGTLLENYFHALLVCLAIPICSIITNQSYLASKIPGRVGPGYEQVVVGYGRVPIAFLVALLYPIPVILFTYLVSCFIRTAESAVTTTTMVSLAVGGIPALVVNILFSIPGVAHDVGVVMHYVFSILVPYYMMPGVMIGLWWPCDVRNPDRYNERPSCSGQFFLEPLVLVPLLGGILLIAIMVLALIGYDRFSASSRLGDLHADIQSSRDEDVVQEEDRAALTTPEEEACLYRGLHHTYNDRGRMVHAVRGISLGIRKGECFGLLGPNGAGKTTTLGCLTGEIRPPTQGEVFVGKHAVTGDGVFEAFRNIGFCPQVDPIIPALSGIEHLLFYGRMKGVPQAALDAEASRILSRLGFSSEDAAKPSETYSGGMKRKLSLAIALIGGSKVLFLDEPSAAVDAAAKRHLWRVIKKRGADQTVVVTTHSMEEAEALCDRLAIQVRGQLRCLGTPIHIKSKYGSGYQLEIFFDKRASTEDDLKLKSFVRTELSAAAQLLECHGGHYIYQLPPVRQCGLSLGQVFTKLENSRRGLGISDYTVAQPSLEQVFLRFAKEQETGHIQ